MNKAELIFVPAPGTSHLVATIEFAKRLIHRDARISITILSINLPFGSAFDALTKKIAASKLDRINLIELPQAELPSFDYLVAPVGYLIEFIHNHKAAVKNAVSNILSSQSSPGSPRVAGLVLDVLCASSMVDVANEFNLPSYILLTFSAGFLGLTLYVPDRHSGNSSVFDESDPEQLITGFLNPVPASVLPSYLFDKDRGYPDFFKMCQKFREAKGLLVNSFQELEPYAINCFAKGQYPPVYPVGPLLNIDGQSDQPDQSIQAQRDKIMKWLDDQPQSSVIFLCFGSEGIFRAPQVKEIARGLEQSGCRFLWSLRMPPPFLLGADDHYDSPEEMLPEGFLETIQGKGMICGWAPQVEVLAHKATLGFVSHCGWNSILESLWFGVPIVTWPIYAEQQLNAFQLVKELGVAVEMTLDYRYLTEDILMANRIEKAIRELMDENNEVRRKVKDIAGMARKANENGGSSFNSWGRLIEDIIGNI